MDLSAATRFASSAGATEVALEELKGLAAAGFLEAFYGMLMLIKWGSYGIFYGIFVIFDVFLKNWDWIGIEMGFWWDGHVVLMAIWRNSNGIWTAVNRI